MGDMILSSFLVGLAVGSGWIVSGGGGGGRGLLGLDIGVVGFSDDFGNGICRLLDVFTD
jgi:hypothetical protein